jgi:hypothetical protein
MPQSGFELGEFVFAEFEVDHDLAELFDKPFVAIEHQAKSVAGNFRRGKAIVPGIELIVDLHLDQSEPRLDLAWIERRFRSDELQVLLPFIVEMNREKLELAEIRFHDGGMKLKHARTYCSPASTRPKIAVRVSIN